MIIGVLNGGLADLRIDRQDPQQDWLVQCYVGCVPQIGINRYRSGGPVKFAVSEIECHFVGHVSQSLQLFRPIDHRSAVDRYRRGPYLLYSRAIVDPERMEIATCVGGHARRMAAIESKDRPEANAGVEIAPLLAAFRFATARAGSLKFDRVSQPNACRLRRYSHAGTNRFSSIDRCGKPYPPAIVMRIVPPVIPHDTDNAILIDRHHRHHIIRTFGRRRPRAVIVYHARFGPLLSLVRRIAQ